MQVVDSVWVYILGIGLALPLCVVSGAQIVSFFVFYWLGSFASTLAVRPDFLYSLVYGNFFQRSNVAGRNKNKMSQNKDKT